MARRFTGEAGAALAFLIGYVCVFLWMLYAYATRRFKWKSRWSLLLFHVTVRVASQACGIGFGVLGFSNTNIFLAYLILGAEGYFTLVLCAFRFLVSWQEHNLPSGESWLEPRRKKENTNRVLRIVLSILLGPLALIIFQRNFMTIVHCFLVLANVAIVTGGSYLAGADYSKPDDPDTKRRMNVAKITRTSGQSVFLACNALLLVAMLITIRNDKRDRKRIHKTLIILVITWFPLIIRGIFGVLQSSVWSLSYYNPDNYEESGFTSRFTIIEYLLGVLTEWLACVLLNATYFTSRNDPPRRKLVQNDEHQEMQNLSHMSRSV